MTSATILFWTIIGLIVLLGYLIVNRYNKAMDKEARDEVIYTYTQHMADVYEDTRKQLVQHAATVQPIVKDNWQFFPIDERRTQA